MNLPSHVTTYIHAQPTDDPDTPYLFAAWGCDMSSCGYIPLAKVEIPLPEITPEQIKQRHLVLLRLKREEVYAEAKKKADELNAQIGRLEAITYNPTTQESPE